MNDFVYVGANTTPNDYENWKEYGVNDDLSIEPYVDEWIWNSITLRDMYVIDNYKLVGAVFFVIDGKYTLACYNDGRKLIKIQDDKHYSEFNSQLEIFNYLRAKRRF
jgi:hypothetical protein